MQQDYDVLIVGGGLAGGCLALALKDTGLRIAVVEATTREQRRNAPIGNRALALAFGTVQMLEALAIWKGVKSAATAIKHIHVSDQGHFGKARLSAQSEGVDALGYVITARDIEEHVADLLQQADITMICPARVVGLMSGEEKACVSLRVNDRSVNVSARLVVGADGGNSSVRRLLNIRQQTKEYNQQAIVTTVKPTLGHGNVAYERFTETGPPVQ